MGARLVVLALMICLAPVAIVPGGQEVPGQADDPGEAAGGPHLRLLDLTESEGAVEVSFLLERAFDDRIQAKLVSGLEVTFRHSVRLQRRRTLWFNRTLAEKKILTSAILDTLTRQYTLRRKVNGGIVETLTTHDVEEMRAFMTRVSGVHLEIPPDLPRDQRTEVRARSELETRFFLFFPYEFDTGWSRWPLEPAAGGAES